MCVCERTFFFEDLEVFYSQNALPEEPLCCYTGVQYSLSTPSWMPDLSFMHRSSLIPFFFFFHVLDNIVMTLPHFNFFLFVCSSRVCQHHFCCRNGVAHYLLYNYCYQSWKTAGALVRCAVFLAAVTCRFSRCWPVMEQKKVYIIGQGNESFHSSPPPYHPPTLPNWSAWSAPVLSVMKGGRVRWNSSSVGNISV